MRLCGVPVPSSSALRLAGSSRQLSTSSSHQFLFRRPGAASAYTIAEQLLQARDDDRLDLVAKLYPQLLKAVPLLPSGSKPPLSRKQLASVHRYVARTPRFSLLLRMFNSLDAFGQRPRLEDHHLLLLGMAQAGKLGKALAWIEAMSATHGINPTVPDWNVILTGYRKAADLEGLRFAWSRLQASGLKPSVVSYNILIPALFEHGTIADVKQVIEDMAHDGVEPDVWTQTALLDGFVEAGDTVSARAVAVRLQRVVETWTPDSDAAETTYDIAALNALLKFECASTGQFADGLRLAEEYRDRGYPLNSWTVNTLAVSGAKGLRTADEAVELVKTLKQATSQPADRRTWTIALKGVLEGPGGLNEALAVHQEARDRGVLPDASMVQPLLSALLLPSPTPETMDRAKQLYEDLATAAKTNASAPDASTYTTLLRACADPSHPDIHFSSTLMADMRERGIRLEPASVTWHIVALMRAAGTFDEAFKVYDAMRALDVSALNHASYNTILAAFTSLPSPVPAPPPLVLEFLSDMRRTACPPSGTTYALLLRYYSRQFRSAASVAQLHALIKLDIHLDPDTALFNALMSAYARVGAFNAAYRVWDGMRANPHGGAGIDDHSISILLDTCGYEGGDNGLARARKVMRELRAERHPLNLKHWDSLVECLARAGDLDGAVETALSTLAPPQGADGVVADVSTLETLLKLARWEEGRWEAVRERIRVERADLWPRLQSVAYRVDDPAAQAT